MSKAYAKGVRDYCRNAQIVYDKFHEIAPAHQTVDQVRRLNALGRGGGGCAWKPGKRAASGFITWPEWPT